MTDGPPAPRKYVLRRTVAKSYRVDYARELNEEQKAVVFAPDGPTLVVAGAGSGKTRTLVYRVSRLIEDGADPSSLLLLTFTNRAAREMKRRVESLIGADGENVEDLEHELNRGIYLRADFDCAFEEYTITPGTIEEFDAHQMGYRRAQVLECNVRRSSFEMTNKVIGWTDNGYYIELLDGVGHVGHRVKVCLQDIRRSFAVADVILPGNVAVGRSLT